MATTSVAPARRTTGHPTVYLVDTAKEKQND